jgi:3D (Asp-Asp-Asp) domain-containing protein
MGRVLVHATSRLASGAARTSLGLALLITPADHRGGRALEAIAAPTPPSATATWGVIEPDGMRRGFAVRVRDGDVEWTARASGGTVADLLRDAGLSLGPLDRLEADPDAPLRPRSFIRIVRVQEFEEWSEIRLASPVTYQDDPETERGGFRVLSLGSDGWVERHFRVRVVDGLEAERVLLDEAVLEAPVPTLVGRGVRLPTVDTPYGSLSYTRSLNVVATYYTPANGGKSPDDPWYGRTATGARATRGVVAVDRRVIPLYSWLYIPGYGIAQALDVGGAIKGNHIDVCFDDGDGAWWGKRFVTAYVLPGPPRRR